MNQKEQILALLENGVDAFENMADSPAGVELIRQTGNPGFMAQFDINFQIKYYSVAAGVYTAVAAAAMPGALQQTLLAFLFGVSDYNSGYPKCIQQNPVTNWTYGVPFIYGAETNPSINGVVIDATVKASLKSGYVVFSYYATSGGTAYAAIVIVSSPQVPFGTLLINTSSDIFIINGVRYSLSDDSAASLLQFKNPWGIYRNNLFGAFKTDSLNPKSFLQPANQQKDVLDIPMKQVIDKNGIIAVPLNYDRVDGVTLSVFVNFIDKRALA